MAARDAMTEEQRMLAAENHNLIYKFALHKEVSAEEYYDIFAIGLCKAAMYFDPALDVRFSTFAFQCMESEYKQYWRRELNGRHIPAGSVISYDALIADDNSDDSFLEIISNSTGKCRMDTAGLEMEEFSNRLPERQRAVLNGFLDGQNGADIALAMGVSRQCVYRLKTKLAEAWKKYNKTEIL